MQAFCKLFSRCLPYVVVGSQIDQETKVHRPGAVSRLKSTPMSVDPPTRKSHQKTTKTLGAITQPQPLQPPQTPQKFST